MGAFFVYILKSAACLALLYPCYHYLLSRDTFHRFNRGVLLGILSGAVLLPIVEFPSVHPVVQVVLDEGQWEAFPVGVASARVPVWSVVLLLYAVGVLFGVGRDLYSWAQIVRLLRSSRREELPDGIRLYIHRKSYAPFSCVNSIVISEADLQEHPLYILAHERAHIRFHHSWDMLAAEICVCLQWFNPIAWQFKRELQTIHEFEVDAEVLRQGLDARQYQLLLIKKAVGARLYSIANSLNHSSLKKRITMMKKKRSHPWARVKLLYALPVAALAVTAFARPELSRHLSEISSSKIMDLAGIWKTEDVKSTEIAPDSLQQSGPVSRQQEEDRRVFRVVEEMPEYPGGMQECLRFLAQNVKYPAKAIEAKTEGRVIVQFTVRADGSIADCEVKRSVSPELDAEAVRVCSMMPDWKPGRQRGQAVDVRYTLPVMFRLSSPTAADLADASAVSVRISSEQPSPAPAERTLFQVVEEMPEFPGGMKECMRFLAQNVKYPAKAIEAKTEGRVIVQFTVRADGSIADCEVKRSVSPELDAEAVRVCSMMPDWKPGRQRGQAVDVRYMLPVMFRLSSPTAADLPTLLPYRSR